MGNCFEGAKKGALTDGPAKEKPAEKQPLKQATPEPQPKQREATPQPAAEPKPKPDLTTTVVIEKPKTDPAPKPATQQVLSSAEPAPAPVPTASVPVPVPVPSVVTTSAPTPVPVLESKPAPVSTSLPVATTQPLPSVSKPAEELLEPIQTIPADNANGILGLGVGSCLEVYSNSYGAWCPGVIQDMDANSVFVAYQVPGDPAESLINTKGLPIESPELRPASDTGAWLNASVEVFSSSKQVWCNGTIRELQNSLATVLYLYPDAPEESDHIMKQLQLGDPDLQLPGAKNALQYRQGMGGGERFTVGTPVEVYSNTLTIWCQGVVQDLREADGIISVAFYYPDMDPQTEAPALKELPIGHPDVRVAMPLPPNGAPVSEAELVAGAAVEVYSESRQFWILAHVKEVQDSLVTVLLRYPDMPPESGLFEKVLPVGHPYIRLPMGDSDDATSPQT